MTNVVKFEAKNESEDKIEENESLYIVGRFSKGEKKGKKIAFKIRNTLMMNPVEPVFEAHPDVDCLIITKDEKKAKRYLKKLFG